MSATDSVPVGPSATQLHVAPLPDVNARRPWTTAARGIIPNCVVFTLLGGVLYAGHHTGWKIAKLSELVGQPSVVADDWCPEHLVPESQCIECQANLFPKGETFGFCREHGVAECVQHHPELAQVTREPQLPQYDTAQALRLIERPANNSRNTLHTSRVQFSSAESLAKSGIDVDVVREHSMMDAVTANGELVFDPTRVAHLSCRVPGTVALVFKGLGDEVAQGEPLILVHAAQVGQAKAQLLQATAQFHLRRTSIERLRPIAASGAVPQKSFIEAEAALKEAEIACLTARQTLANFGFEVPDQLVAADPQQLADVLRFLGISAAQVALLPHGTQTANLLPLRAPYDGMIIAADVVAGEVVDPSRTLFTVADPSRLWLLLSVRQEDARYVRRGLPVQFRTDDDGQEVTGSIVWISPAVEAQTRTLQVRVAIANSGGRLRDKTFGTGRIILRAEPHAVVVPHAAVQSTSDAHFVFVRDKNFFDPDAPKFFHVRQVRTGGRDEQQVELLAGVLPGEVVVTTGSSVLMAKLLRSQLGAGCACHKP